MGPLRVIKKLESIFTHYSFSARPRPYPGYPEVRRFTQDKKNCRKFKKTLEIGRTYPISSRVSDIRKYADLRRRRKYRRKFGKMLEIREFAALV